MKNHFPPIDNLLQMEPEEISRYLLLYLNFKIDGEQAYNKFGRYNIINSGAIAQATYAPGRESEASIALSEAWNWLESNGLLVLDPEEAQEWYKVSRRGRKIQSESDSKQFAIITLIPWSEIDDKLSKKTIGPFTAGEFDTAVGAAFKEVEIRVRQASRLTNRDIGVDLARKAFNPQNGPLTDRSHPGEAEALRDLFAGAIGSFKNPTSHRDVDYENPVIAASIILFANTLIQIANSRAI